jgi:hypothetical protein
MAARMKRDPFRGLSAPARVFVFCAMILLLVIFGLAVYAIFFIDSRISKPLGVLFFIGFGLAVLWFQLVSARTLKETSEWGGGPGARTLSSTQAALERDRRAKRSPEEKDEP